MVKVEKLLKNLANRLKGIKTTALQFKSNHKAKMPSGYKLKPLPGRPTHNSKMSTSNGAGTGPASTKNPMKVAQQVKGDAKPEAVARAKSLIKFLPNGQWQLKK